MLRRHENSSICIAVKCALAQSVTRILSDVVDTGGRILNEVEELDLIVEREHAWIVAACHQDANLTRQVAQGRKQLGQCPITGVSERLVKGIHQHQHRLGMATGIQLLQRLREGAVKAQFIAKRTEIESSNKNPR